MITAYSKEVSCSESLPVYPFNLFLASDFKIAGEMCHLSLTPSQVLVQLKAMNGTAVFCPQFGQNFILFFSALCQSIVEQDPVLIVSMHKLKKFSK